jgi:ABC-type bacteriocin/lantibiotic exporter with double-glycine peptidase domain
LLRLIDDISKYRGAFKLLKPTTVGALLRAVAYLGPHRLDVIAAGFALLLVSAANLAVPLLIRYCIDTGVVLGQKKAIIMMISALLAIVLVRALFAFLQNFLAERAAQRALFGLRESGSC